MNKKSRTHHLAAIDIGSNAMRAMVFSYTPKKHITILHELREPLRLGEDVFANGLISQKKIDYMEEVFVDLLHLFSKYQVSRVHCVATSAMREAKNAKRVITAIAQLTSIPIQVITGQEEARLIHRCVVSELDLNAKKTIIIDIGGGSTEIILSSGLSFVAAKSFNMGTVRLLQLHQDKKFFQAMDSFATKVRTFKENYWGFEPVDCFVGTGGNLRRMGKLRKKLLFATSSQYALRQEIREIYQNIKLLSYDQRIKRLDMRPDRADVIVPATAMIDAIMSAMNIDKIHLPRVGLKEGVLWTMVHELEKSQF